MEREKAQREDLLLDARPAHTAVPGGDVEDDLAPQRGGSRLWQQLTSFAPQPGSAKEGELARAGRHDPTIELPFRAELEPLLGEDLGGVPVHAGAHAEAASRQLGAHAYTVDGAIVLGSAQPSKELVAHELTHVLRGRGAGAGAAPEAEAEADRVAATLAAGERVDASALRGAGDGVRKKAKTPTEALRELLASLATDEYVDGDALRVIEHEELAHDDRAGGQRTTTGVKHTVDGRAGFDLSSETTVTTGTVDKTPRSAAQLAAERKQTTAAIEQAQTELHTQIVLVSFEQWNETVRAGRLERQAEELADGNLDAALVAGKQALLRGDARRARARAAAIEAEVEVRKHMIKTLEAGLADLDAHDAWVVAQELAQAELSFRAKLKVTKKDALGLSVLKLSLSKERARSETATSDDGSSLTTAHGRKTTIGAGKGVHGQHAQTDGYTIADANGDVVHGEETTRTHHGGVAMGGDGSVGLDGGSKLAKALENSYGKVTTSVACGGSVTVNVIALPKANAEAPQTFSVVVTVNLSAALALGAAKSKARKHGKGSASVEAGASLQGALTHTHILDAEGAAGYLEALEQTGAGDRVAAGKAPEFGVLQLALTGGESVDDVASAAAASLGSADAAAGMGVDESVELTLRAGAAIDVALSAEREGGKTSAGVSAGAAAEQYRTLKVARLAGAPGQELVEVTVMFGDKRDQHGALSASALGVTASAGRRQWRGGEQAVTFRLDASARDEYATLYHEIVATSSRAGLVALRKSPRYRGHVQSFTDRVEQGGEDKLGIKGQLGVATTDSWARSSSKGKQADGRDTAEEVGSSTTAVGFSVGPLELLRRSQTASAKLEARDGTSMLDLAETTEQTGLGGFEVPTLREVLAAESPMHALQAALTETRRTLAGFLLDPDELLELARRAKDQPAWSRVPIAAKVATLPSEQDYATWATLREQLVKPKLDEEYSIDQLPLAREVARGRAIAEFMAHTGKAKGVRYLQVVLREYGAHGGDSAELGLNYEFPKGVKPETFIDLRFRLKCLDRALSSAGSEGEGLEHCAQLELDTAKMLEQLRLADFQSERSRIEMMHDLRERVLVVGQRRRALERAVGGGAADAGVDVQADAAAQVHHREETVMQSKCSEVRLLQRCETVLAREPSSIEINDELGPILVEGGQLDEVFELHVRLLLGLRATYRAAGTPEAAWLCSVDIHDQARAYDVGMDRALTALWAYYKAQPYRLGEASYEPRKQRWHRKFWAY